jgi:hypothetical protein
MSFYPIKLWPRDPGIAIAHFPRSGCVDSMSVDRKSEAGGRRGQYQSAPGDPLTIQDLTPSTPPVNLDH